MRKVLSTTAALTALTTLGVVVLTLSPATPAGASSSTGQPSVTVVACRSNSGVIRVPKKGERCRSTEIALINAKSLASSAAKNNKPAASQGSAGPAGIQGLKGDTGAKGDVGPQGPQGPQGPAGAATSGSALSVYDINGTKVGGLVTFVPGNYPTALLVDMGGQVGVSWFVVASANGSYTNDWTLREFDLVYETADCSGTSYVDANYLVGSFATFAGGDGAEVKMYRPSGPIVQITIQSRSRLGSPCEIWPSFARGVPLTVVSNSAITIQGPISVR